MALLPDFRVTGFWLNFITAVWATVTSISIPASLCSAEECIVIWENDAVSREILEIALGTEMIDDFYYPCFLGPALSRQMSCIWTPGDYMGPGMEYRVCGATENSLRWLCTNGFDMDDEGNVNTPPNATLLDSLEQSSSAAEPSSTAINPSVSLSEPTPPSIETSDAPPNLSSAEVGKEFNISLSTVELAGTIVAVVCGVTLLMLLSMFLWQRRTRLGGSGSPETATDHRSELPASDLQASHGIAQHPEVGLSQTDSSATDSEAGQHKRVSLSRTHEMPSPRLDHRLEDDENASDQISSDAGIQNVSKRGCSTKKQTA